PQGGRQLGRVPPLGGAQAPVRRPRAQQGHPGRGRSGDEQAPGPAPPLQGTTSGPPPHAVRGGGHRVTRAGARRRAMTEVQAMRMSDFVVRDAIGPDLKATTKEGVIREMVESLRTAGYFKGGEQEDIVKAILKRELLGSTGIGRSVAIPHSKHNTVDRL